MTNSGGKTIGRTPPSARQAALIGAAVVIAATASAPSVASAAVQTPEAEQRIVLVTGSTSGLGREVARRLASTGTHVIIHGRNVERGAALVEAIEREGVGSARFYRADFASLKEVREFGEAILRDYDRLDVLVNNAGIGSRVPPVRTLSADGYELRFQVNSLSHFLLTQILMDRIVASTPARIVNVASGGQTRIDFDDPMMEKGYSGLRAYNQSKLAQVIFTFALARQLEGMGVVVNTLHPATFMDTRMVRMGGFVPRSTVAEGADAVINLVETSDLESGQYFNALEPTRANDQVYEEEARKSCGSSARSSSEGTERASAIGPDRGVRGRDRT